MKDLEGKVVLVTGSARRVGRAIVLAFAAQGANCVIHYSSANSAADAESAAEEVRAFGGEALVIKGNQANSADIATIIDAVRDRFGRLDVLVNSASIFMRRPFLEVTEQEYDTVLNINLKGPFLLTQAAARLMIANGGGAIVNISDNSGINPWASRPQHSISKAGVIMLTQVSALALAPYHIRVNCVVPGPVLVAADSDESTLDGIAAALPVKHIGNPGNVADACLFLARNDYATGTILNVDGGERLVGGQT